MDNLAKELPIPLYYQIKTRLLEAIEGGQWRPGDRVPSERELTERFAVSRMTARQTLTELETQGYLRRVQGKGTFVATPKLEQPLVGLTSFSEDMRRRGLVPGATVLSAALRPAGRREAQALGVSESTVFFRLERLRLAGGDPMALEISHVPASRCPGIEKIDFTGQSLYRILAQRFGLAFIKAVQSLEAVSASSYEADILKVRDGSPLLQIERVSHDPQDRPAEFVRFLYRGDRYRFTTELIRAGDAR